jgi:hypothetical protein
MSDSNFWKPVRGNDIFKYIFINRENRISLTNTKVGGDLEVTGSTILTKLNNTTIGYDVSGLGAFTDLSSVNLNGINSTVVTSTTTGNNIVGGNLIVTGSANLTSAVISGDLTVYGTTTTNTSSNTTIVDTLIELGNGATGTPTKDSGIVIERGSSTNVFMGWDETAGKFNMGTTSATGATSGNVIVDSVSTLVANIEGSLTGNASTVTNGLYTNGVGTIISTLLADSSVTNAKITDANVSLAKLSALNAGQFILGNASNRPTGVTLTGDVTVSSSGVSTIGANKIVSSMILDDSVTLSKLQNITTGSIIIGGTSNAPELLDIKASGKFIIGNGTTGRSVAMSGDSTIDSNGVVTISNTSVSLAKLQNINTGSIIVGGSSNIPTLLDAKSTGNILIGDGTTLKSVALSGDASINSSGALTISNSSIDTGMIVNNAVTLDKIQNITIGSVIIGGASNEPELLDVKDTGKMIVGNGTTARSVSMSGDATIDLNGVITVGNSAISLIKLQNVATGSIIVGGNSNIPTLLDSKTSGNILVGNGSTLTSVPISGDASIQNDGTLTISNASIENSMLASNAVTAAKITDSTITLAKLENVTSGKIIVGNNINRPTAVAMSGDASISSTGVLSIASGAVTTDKIAGSNVTLDKLENVVSGKIIVGSSGNRPTAVTLSGDATLSNTGAITINSVSNITSIGNGSTLDITANTTVSDGAYDFNIASHDGTNGLKLGGTLVSSSAVELNKLDGLTASTVELNKLDGVTATTSELNYLDVTVVGTSENSKALTQSSSGVVTLGSVEGNQVINIASHDLVDAGLKLNNVLVTSSAAEINLVDGVSAGVVNTNKAVIYSSTGKVNASGLQISGTDITSSAAELNLIDGSSAGNVINSKSVIYGSNGEVNASILQVGGTSITSTPAEINKLDGLTATTAELNYLDVTTLGTSENSKVLTQSTGGVVTVGVANGNQLLNIASHDLVDAGLQLNGTLVTSSASEINLLDTAVSGSIVNGKSVVYGANGQVNATTLQLAGTDITSSASELNKLDGLTATTSELNYLDLTTLGQSENNKVLTQSAGGLTLFGTVEGDQVFHIRSHDLVNGGLKLGSTLVTASGSEINVLDGLTSSTAELNILDGVTATTSELNLINGSIAGSIVNSKSVIYGSSGEVNANTLQIGGTSITSSALELNKLDGYTGSTSELNYLDMTTLGTSQNSKALTQSASGVVTLGSIEGNQVLNIASHDLVDGGLKLNNILLTASATELNTMDGITSSTAELNILDGATLTTAELNIISGITLTTNELNILDGNTSYTPTIVLSTDGVILNDGGVMKQITVQSLADQINTNITSIGVLNTIEMGGFRDYDPSTGIQLYIKASDVRDIVTPANSTVANAYVNSIRIPTIKALNTSVTTTNASTFHIAGAPIAGSNMTLGTTYSLLVDAGTSKLGGNLIVKEGISLGNVTNTVIDVESVTGTDTTGKSLTIAGGKGTGSGTGGSIIFKVADGGSSGSSANTLATALTISDDKTIAATGNVTVSGNLTVNGTTTTISTQNTVMSDSLIELSNGATSATNDSGLVIERGTTGDNAFMGWDESADKFTMGTTTATGASTGDITVTPGTLVANIEGNVTGNLNGTVNTATQASITTMTGLISVGSTGVNTVFTGPVKANEGVLIPDGSTIGSVSDTNAIGIAANGIVSFTATTESTSETTGGVTIAGGLGVTKDLYVGNDVRLNSENSILTMGSGSDIITLEKSTSKTVKVKGNTIQLESNSTGSVILESNAGSVVIGNSVTPGTLDINSTSTTIDATVLSIDSTDSTNLTMTANNAGNKTMIIKSSNTGLGAGLLDINADGAITIDSGTSISIDAGAASNITTSVGALTLDGAAGVSIAGNAAEVDITTTGAVDINSAAFTLDGSTVSIDATDSTNLTMLTNSNDLKSIVISATNVGAGVANIDMDADGAVTIDAVGAISLDAGSASNLTTSVGALTLDGAAGVSIAGNAAEVDITTTGAVDINSAAFTLDGSTVSIDATDSTNVTMTANAAGDKTMVINAVNSGDGVANINMNADGAISINAVGASNLSTSVGPLTLSSASAATWSTGAGALSLDGAAGVSIVGNAAEVDITTTGAVDINSAAFTVDGSTVSIDGTDSTNLTMTSNAGATKTLTIAATNADASNVANIDMDADGAITIDAAAGLSLDAGAASNLTTSVGVLTLDGAAGISIVGNAAEVDITTTGAVDINSSAFTVDGTTVSIDGTDSTNLTMTANTGATETMVINASNTGAGVTNLDIDADGSFTIDGVNSSYVRTSSGTVNLDGAGGITLEGNSSEIDITTTGKVDINSGSFTLDGSTVSIDGNNSTNLTMSSNSDDAKSLVIAATNSGSGVANVDIDADGSVTIDAVGASNFTTSTGALTLTSAVAATWGTSAGNLTLDSAGDIILNADGDQINMKFGGASGELEFSNENTGDVVIQSKVDTKDLVFKQFDGTETLRLLDNANVSVKSDLTVEGGKITLSNGATINSETSGQLILTEDQVTTTGNLVVPGTFTLTGAMTSSSNVSVGGNLTVVGSDIILGNAANTTLAVEAVSGTDTSGKNLTVSGGQGTGTGVGGSILFQVADGGLTGSSANTLVTALTIADDRSITAAHDMTVSGNLTVSGTTTTINSTTVNIIDPVFEIGADSADDNLDRGIKFKYHNGTAAKAGFFGFDDSDGKFLFIPDATDTSNTFSGTKGTIKANIEGEGNGIDSLTVISPLGGIDITAGNDIDITTSANNGSINITPNNIGSVVIGSSSNTLTSIDALAVNLTSVNAMTLTDGIASLVIGGTGATSLSGATTFDLDSTSDIQINSSAGTIGIGNDAVTGSMNIGTGAASRTITIGNATGATGLVFSSGTGDIKMTSTDVIQLDGTNSVELNSSTGAIAIGNDAVTGAINIGTGASGRTITLGNAASTAANINALAVNLTSVNAMTISDGSASLVMDGTGATTLSDVTTLDLDTSGDIQINSSTGTIGIGNDANTGAMNIGTGAAARTLTIGNNTTTSGLVLSAGTGDIVASSTDAVTIDAVGILELNSSVGAIGIGNDANTGAINLGSGDSARTITVGHTNSTAVNLNAQALTLTSVNALAMTDGTATLQLGGTGATTLQGVTTLDIVTSDALTIDSTGAASHIKHTGSVGGDFTIAMDGANNASLILSSAGTATDALQVTASTGGMDITSGGTMDITTSANNSTINILPHGTGSLVLGAVGNTAATLDAKTFSIDAAGGGSSNITHNALANAQDLTIGVTGIFDTSLVLSSTGTGADALQVTSSAGGMDITSAGILDITTSAGNSDINIDPHGTGNLALGSADNTITSLSGNAVNITSVGAMTLSDGSASLVVDGSGATSLSDATTLDLDTTGAIQINSSAGAISIGNDANVGDMNIGSGAAARNITIGNNTTTTGLTLTSGTGDIVASSTDAVTIDATGVLELNSSVGAIGIGNDANTGAINVGTGAAARTITVGNNTGASGLVLTAGTGDIVASSADAFTIDSTNNVELNSASGAINIGNDAVTGGINIGTGASARSIGIGNNSSTAVNMNALAVNLTSINAMTLSDGTSSVVLNGSGATSIQGATTLDIDTTGVLTIDSAGAASHIKHTGSANGDFTIAMDGESDASLVLSSAGSGVDALQVSSSAGGMDITSAGILDMTTSANNAAINITSHGTGTVTLGQASNTAANISSTAVNITSSGATTLTDGTASIILNGSGAYSLDSTTINMTGSSTMAIDSAGAASHIKHTGTLGGDFTVAMDGTADASLILSSAGTGIDALQLTSSAGGMDITSDGNIDIITSANNSDINILPNGTGSLVLGASTNTSLTLDATAFSIDGSAGTSNITSNTIANSQDFNIGLTGATDSSLIISSTGTATDALQVTASVGGMDITSAGVIDMTTSAGNSSINILPHGSGSLVLGATSNTAATLDAKTFSIDAAGGGSSNITHNALANTQDLTVAVTGAFDTSLILSSTGTGIDALQLTSSAGGMDITSAGILDITTSAGNSAINIDPHGTGNLVLGSADNTVTSLSGNAINVTSVGAMTLSDGSASLVMDGTGATSLSGSTTLDLDTTGAIQINSTAGAISIGNDNAAQNINLGTQGARTIALGSTSATSTSLVGTAINITSSNALNLTDGTATLQLGGTGNASLQGTSTLDIDTTGALTINSAGSASHIKHAGTLGGDFTVAMDGAIDASLILSSAGTGADALQVTSSAGGMDITSASTMDISTSAGNTGINIDPHGSGSISLGSADNANITLDALAFSIDSAGGASNISSNTTGDGQDLTVAITGITDSSLILSSTGTAADALQVTSSAGGMDITSALTLDMSTSSSNSNITMTPNGTGSVVVSKVDINGGSIDGTIIGAASTAAGSFTTLTASSTVTAIGGVVLENGETLTNAVDGTVIINGSTLSTGSGAGVATISSNGDHNLTLQTGNSITGSITIVDGSNADISLIPHGTGNVNLSTDTVIVGDAASAAAITTNGAGTLTINTNDGTNSGSIIINNGVNGNISLTPNGTGEVDISKVDINSGTIDGTVIGGVSAAPATVTTLIASTSIDITGTTGLILENDNTVTNSVAGTVVINSDIAAGSGSATGVFKSNGDYNTIVKSGRINTGSITISGTVDNGDITVSPHGTGDIYLTADTNIIGDSGSTAYLKSNGNADLQITTGHASTGTLTLANGLNANISLTPHGTGSVVMSKVDINGGSIDGSIIGAGSTAAGSFTTLSASSTVTATGGIILENNESITNASNGEVLINGDTLKIGSGSDTGILSSNGNYNLQLKTGNVSSGNITITDGVNQDIIISPNGSGSVSMAKVAITGGSITSTTISGSSGDFTAVTASTSVDITGSAGLILENDNTITNSTSGTIVANCILAAGSGSATGTFQSNGSHNVVLQTGNVTTGSITITDGANGDISINPNGSGIVSFSKAGITGGNIDGTIIGATTTAAASFTTLSASSSLTVGTDLTVSGSNIILGNGANSTLLLEAVTGTDTAGKNLSISGGQGTGTGAGGSIIFQVADAGGVTGSTANALVTALTIADDKSITAAHNMTVTGNLTVSGTTTTVNSTTVSIADPVFEIGADSSDDNLDRGIKFKYHNGSVAKAGFFGFDDTDSTFTFIPDAAGTNVFSGTVGTIKANLSGTISTATQNSITTMTGLNDIGTIGSAATFNGHVVATQGFRVPDNGTIGSNSATGAIVINSAGQIKVAAATDSTSVDTGALIVSGGAGITKDLIIGNDMKLLSDSSIIAMGTDSDFTITHNGSTGATLGTIGAMTMTAGNSSTWSTSTGSLTLDGNAGLNLTSSSANSNITLTPHGTGDVIVSSDTLILGDSDATATITSNGTGNLSLSTNSGTNSGSIVITQGANADITIDPNGSGNILLGSADVAEIDLTAVTVDVNTSGAITMDAGAASTLTTTGGAITLNGKTAVDLQVDSTTELSLTSTTATFGTNVLLPVNGTIGVSGNASAISITGSDVTIAGLGVSAVNASGRILTTNATDATTTTNGSIQTAGGLSVVLDAVLGNDLKLLSDNAVLSFGADSEISITHVADTGLQLSATTAATSTTKEVLNLTHTTTSVPAVGIGSDIAFTVETAADNNEKGMILQALTTDVTAAAEDFDFVVKLMEAGGAAAEKFRVSSAGTITGTLFSGSAASLTSIPSGQLTGTVSVNRMDPAQTTITSLLAADIKIGEDDETKIDFETANVINFYVDNSKQLTLSGSTLTPGSNNGTALGSSSRGFSDLYLGDGGLVKFGNDQDVTLTHVADTGLLLNSNMQLQFRDSAIHISSDTDGYMNIQADIGVNVNIGGTDELAITSTTATFGTNIVIPNAGSIGSVSDTNALTISAGGVIDITATTASTNSTTGALTVAGGLGVAADLFIGDDLTLASDSAVLTMGSTGPVTLTHVASNILKLGSGDKLAFGDDADYISGNGTDLSIVSSGAVNIDGTLVSIDGTDSTNLTMTANAAATKTLTIAATNSNASNVSNIDMNADGAITITADGTSELAGTTVTLNSSGGITLDADNGTITFADGGLSLGTITSSGYSGYSLTAGTVTTVDQPNITSVGTLTSLTVDSVAIDGKIITMTGDTDDTAVFTAGANGTLDITTTDAGGAAANITITADGTSELAGTTVTLNSSGGITLDADNGTITFADGGVSLGTITSSGYSGYSLTAGTVTTAAQPNITSVGTLVSLTVDSSTNPILENTLAPNGSADVTDTILIAELKTQIIQGPDLSEATTYTLDTAANIIAGFTGCSVGDSFDFYIINTDGTYAITISGGTGGTITGNAVVATNTSAHYRIRFTNVTSSSEAYTVYRLN